MSNKKIGISTSGGDCGGLNAAINLFSLELKINIIWMFME